MTFWYTTEVIITYYGKQFFKVQQGDLTIALNPIAKESGYKGTVARFGADIVLSTLHHPDYNGLETVTYGEREPFIVDGPGDFEVKNVFIKGAMTKTLLDKKEYINTVYSFIVDGMTVVFLGGIQDLSPEAKELITDADILFVPVGELFMAPGAAYKLAVSLESSIVIPMDFGNMQSGELKQFLKEGGAEKVTEIDKLTIKKKDLEGKVGEIVLLSYGA
jgi:L-ascorbate metabolism protein UlaG (beta-lactamase superfamily)